MKWEPKGQAPRRVPVLPPPGWMPDPSRTDLERYWDGRAWTPRVRDVVSKLERVPLAPVTASKRQRARQDRQRARQDRQRARERGERRRWAAPVLVVALGAATVLWLGWTGSIPQWVPGASALQQPMPQAAEVEYPVFGSDELVIYLAKELVAQQPRIDVTYWSTVLDLSTEAINDAYLEALYQNPYVFAGAWSTATNATGMWIEPEYHYDADMANARRSSLRAAVTTAVAETGALGIDSEVARAAAVHDYVVRRTQYDYDSYAEIEANATGPWSPMVAQSQQAYGALVAGSAVCTGYAQAVTLLGEAAGLESVIVTGYADGGVTSGGHAWNKVLVDGQWLVVDATWDDNAGGTPGREYFLLSDSDPALATRTADADWVVDARLVDYAG